MRSCNPAWSFVSVVSFLSPALRNLTSYFVLTVRYRPHHARSTGPVSLRSSTSIRQCDYGVACPLHPFLPAPRRLRLTRIRKDSVHV
jgi:hypothetical protein